jgi:hypothetical protein
VRRGKVSWVTHWGKGDEETHLLIESNDLLHLVGGSVENVRNALHLGASGVLHGELEIESDVVLGSGFGVNTVRGVRNGERRSLSKRRERQLTERRAR